MKFLFSRSPRFGFYSTASQVTESIDASGLTTIVTGGSSGIGAETAKILALRGAHVIIAVRNLEAASEVKNSILVERQDAKVDISKLDLSSIASVQSFVQEFQSRKIPLHILINNAAVMQCPFLLSDDKIEMHFATNHIGHFLLTKLLLPEMKATAKESGREGRIVILTSSWHEWTYPGGIRFDKINAPEGYVAYKSYGQSKLANILHCKELARRLKEEGANITVNCVHPGIIFTNLQRHILLGAYLYRVFCFFIWKTVPQGASTTCYVALHPDWNGISGKYFSDCKEATPSQIARDPDMARKLWDFTENLISNSISRQ